MAIFKPFNAVRPAPEHASEVAALPYDVMSADEARLMANGKPYSFLHVDKAEIDLAPDADPHSDAVYAQAEQNLTKLINGGVLLEDGHRRFYVYSQTMNGREQSGLVGCASVDDYIGGVIKKHELTRVDKENDRVRHVETLNAHTGPIFLTCRDNGGLSGYLREAKEKLTPLYDFTAEDGVRHSVWALPETENARLEKLFAGIPCLYIADGHHRCASACRVGQERRGAGESGIFLAVVFPADELKILDYNRTVSFVPEGFTEKLSEDFEVAVSSEPVKPRAKHSFGLYMSGQWYMLTAKRGGGDLISDLDVSILQERVLDKILGITDPRTDSRVDFIGGIRGLKELERLVDSGRAAAAFSMHPTSLDELMDIADAGLLMPPKSTWFEPKLRSGLFIHRL